MQIGYLADHQDFIPTLAQWHHREWVYLRPGDSLEARTARLRASCGHREIPTVMVSFTGGTLLGSAMLVAHDMDTRMELSPWLAGVFVAPNHRRHGIGAALVRRAVDDATATWRAAALPLHSEHRAVLLTPRVVACRANALPRDGCRSDVL